MKSLLKKATYFKLLMRLSPEHHFSPQTIDCPPPPKLKYPSKYLAVKPHTDRPADPDLEIPPFELPPAAHSNAFHEFRDTEPNKESFGFFGPQEYSLRFNRKWGNKVLGSSDRPDCQEELANNSGSTIKAVLKEKSQKRKEKIQKRFGAVVAFLAQALASQKSGC